MRPTLKVLKYFYDHYPKSGSIFHFDCAYTIRAKYAIYMVPTPKEIQYAIYVVPTTKEAKFAIYMVPTPKRDQIAITWCISHQYKMCCNWDSYPKKTKLYRYK